MVTFARSRPQEFSRSAAQLVCLARTRRTSGSYVWGMVVGWHGWACSIFGQKYNQPSNRMQVLGPVIGPKCCLLFFNMLRTTWTGCCRLGHVRDVCLPSNLCVGSTAIRSWTRLGVDHVGTEASWTASSFFYIKLLSEKQLVATLAALARVMCNFDNTCPECATHI